MFLVVVGLCALVGGVLGAIAGGIGGFLLGGFIGFTLGVLLATPLIRKKRGNVPPPIPTSRPQASSSPSSSSARTPAPEIAESRSRQVAPLRWVEPGEEIIHSGHRIQSGLFYVSDGAPPSGEESAINRRLSVGKPARGPEAQLGYYSQYDCINPNQRGSYLEWLAAGRRDEDPASRDLGYIFLFFYGCERRLLIDQGEGQEIIAEIVRLLDRYVPYCRSRSFQNYACQLIHFWGWQQGAGYYARLWDWMETLPVSLLGQDELAFVLASHLRTEKPLTAILAYDIVSRHPDARRSVIIRRVNEEFRSLFKRRYDERYPNGLGLRAAKRETIIEYRPASPSLLADRYNSPRGFSVSVPDVMGVPSQFAPLVEIWNSCVEDLSSYSRQKAKQVRPVGDFRVYLTLPEELRTSTPHPLENVWRQLLAQSTHVKTCSVTSVDEVAAVMDTAKRDRLTVGQSRELAQVIESLGYAVEPDARYEGSAYEWPQELAVYKPVCGKVIAPSSTYCGVAALLELCVFVAAADGEITSAELTAVADFIGKQVKLSETDQERLHALEQLLTHDDTETRRSIARIAKRVPIEQRAQIAEILVYVAAADNIVTKDEQRALERIFRAFELPDEKLPSLLASIRSDIEEVKVRGASPRVDGEAIPQVTGFSIDMSRVAKIADETREVIAILSQVMTDDAEAAQIVREATSEADKPGIPETLTRPIPAAESPLWLSELDTKYHAVVLRLIEKPSWSKTSFDLLAKEHHLMPLSVHDAVNEWADEHLGDFLLEGIDPICVHQNLISELKHG